MAGWTPRWKGVVTALALVLNVSATGGLVASATVAPRSGYAGAKLVATFSFTPKSSWLGIPPTSVLVFRQYRELGDQPSPINYRHQVHNLYAVDRPP